MTEPGAVSAHGTKVTDQGDLGSVWKSSVTGARDAVDKPAWHSTSS